MKLTPSIKILAKTAHDCVVSGVPLSDHMLGRLQAAHNAVGDAKTPAEQQLCSSVYTLLEYPNREEAIICVSAALDLIESFY